jgi:hypothetical protein
MFRTKNFVLFALEVCFFCFVGGFRSGKLRYKAHFSMFVAAAFLTLHEYSAKFYKVIQKYTLTTLNKTERENEKPD